MAIHATLESQTNTGSQRGAARMRMRIEASGSLGTGEGAVVVIHNLSATGMLIETTSELAIGQQLMVALPEAPDVVAVIVWRSDALAGCRFAQPLSRATLSAAQLRNPLPSDVDPAIDLGRAETLPQRLRRLRLERGLSRAALSAKVGASTPSVWAWETGKTVPRRNNLVVLADALGVSEQELVMGDDASSWSADTDTRGNAGAIQSLIDTSKARIAATAGVTPSQVKISIEF
ncbi:MAG: helix-turn-helix domain-containing protein [Sphingopyxis sp.]|nr:helix-turn-helix domain-containing protein [Sphingopyxis sp.]